MVSRPSVLNLGRNPVKASILTCTILEGRCGDLLILWPPRQALCVSPLLITPATNPSGAVCLVPGLSCPLCVSVILQTNICARIIRITCSSCITGQGDLIVLFPSPSLSAPRVCPGDHFSTRLGEQSLRKAHINESPDSQSLEEHVYSPLK